MSEIIVEQLAKEQSRPERRRPGRPRYASPGLVGIMRAPSAAAEREVARYDAAVPLRPAEPLPPGSTLDLMHFTTLAGAAGFCVLGWLTVLELMLLVLR